MRNTSEHPVTKKEILDLLQIMKDLASYGEFNQSIGNMDSLILSKAMEIVQVFEGDISRP